MSRNNGLLEICSPKQATVDIVLVHGLHGDRVKTWTYTSLTKSVFWPARLLPDDIPKARILSFGYDASITHFWSRSRPSENRLDTLSDDLFQQLNDYRYNSGTTGRPIILVAHSLGGLVCANALVDAASGLSSLQDVAQSVRRIAFIGTPHEGSEKARWAETGRRFLSIFKTTNKELTKDLTSRSEKLAKLSVQFPVLLSTRSHNPATAIDVVCFFEGLSMRKFGLDFDVVVTESSACLPGYERRLLEANHQNMVKFKIRDDRNYQRIIGVLQRWAKELGIIDDSPAPVIKPATFFGHTIVETIPVPRTTPLELDANPPRDPHVQQRTQPRQSVRTERHYLQDEQQPRYQEHREPYHDRYSTYPCRETKGTPVVYVAEQEYDSGVDDEVLVPQQRSRQKQRVFRSQDSQAQTPAMGSLGSVQFLGECKMQIAYNTGTINL